MKPSLLHVVRAIQECPWACVPHPSYFAVCAYIMGYDHCLVAAGNGSVGLDFFREWIVAKNGGGVETHWIDLVPNFCRNPESATDEEKCETLFSIIEEFWADREARGVQAIVDDFNKAIGFRQ